LDKLLRAVALENTGEEYRIARFGGCGSQVWEIESRLDGGQHVSLPLGRLVELANEPEAVIDTLYCISGTLVFGISDATFMFVQADDKKVEERIAGFFESVEDSPDIKAD